MYVSYRGHFLNTKIEGKDLHAHMLQHICIVKNCFCKKSIVYHGLQCSKKQK